MKRVLVDLRILIVVVVILGAALAIVGVELAGVYNAPVQHVTDFSGQISAKMINYSTVVSLQNFTVTGVPAGALLGFNWVTTSPGEAGVVASARGAGDVCNELPSISGGCSWTANGQTLTVMIWDLTPVLPGYGGGNWTEYVTVQGWYVYTTPAI